MPSLIIVGDSQSIQTIGNGVHSYNFEKETRESEVIFMKFNEDKTCMTLETKNKDLFRAFSKNITKDLAKTNTVQTVSKNVLCIS